MTLMLPDRFIASIVMLRIVVFLIAIGQVHLEEHILYVLSSSKLGNA